MIANPLGSLSESAEPDSPPTVENLKNIGVYFPTSFKNLALQYLLISFVTVKTP